MNGFHVHVVSDDKQVKGVVFQIRAGFEVEAVIDMCRALDNLAEKREMPNYRRDLLGIFVADETIESLAPENGLELLWMQIVEEQLDGKAKGESCD